MKKVWKECKSKFTAHPFWCSIFLSIALGAAAVIIMKIFTGFRAFTIFEPVFDVLLIGGFFIYPLILTLLNLIFLFKPNQGKKARHAGRIIEYTTVAVGLLFTLLYMSISSINYFADYYVQLYNAQVHTPIYTESWPTLIVMACVALLGYLIQRIFPLAKQPPLVTVLSLSAMYMGIIICAVYIVQISGFSKVYHDSLVFSLYPFNLIIIALKVIKEITIDWKSVHPAEEEAQFGEKKRMLALNKILCRACMLPVVAFVALLPLLGIIIAILTLMGQAPDSIIRAWTQTAEWTLSQQTAPPNIYYDEHYLCTVAAGGHSKVVKPLRNGKRHGHDVIVNRQLCVANAFEQLLEERTPKFHKFIRGVYDKYGYPIARHIRTKTAADIVYFIMKPLEWIFLAVLYLCDVHPENRIAVQYPHKPLPDKYDEK